MLSMYAAYLPRVFIMHAALYQMNYGWFIPGISLLPHDYSKGNKSAITKKKRPNKVGKQVYMGEYIPICTHLGKGEIFHSV